MVVQVDNEGNMGIGDRQSIVSAVLATTKRSTVEEICTTIKACQSDKSWIVVQGVGAFWGSVDNAWCVLEVNEQKYTLLRLL